MRIACHLMVASMFTACVSSAKPQPATAPDHLIGVDADTDTLLKTLADLSRTGVDALCNQAYVEKKLNIKIVRPSISTSSNTRSTSAEVEPMSTNTKFFQAYYRTYTNGFKSSCSLHIGFNKPLLCDVASARVEAILGSKTEYTSPFPGRAMQGVFYMFQPFSGASSRIDLGIMGAECVSGFSVGVERKMK